uniref:Ion transport domain-containing protein n=1 Tax=Leptocylindrus danicus TaxID=163516 RepID=A0A7S2NVJ0_9STRA
MNDRKLFAATIFFQTCFMIHFLRIINQSLAVFITALVQVISDLKWFMIVLLILLCMFSQMFLAIIPGTLDLNVTIDVDEMDFTYRRFFKESYRMLLGDWDVEGQRLEDPDVYPIFVMFTFVLTIIMLNMLIAIASDSYADAKEMGPKLFRILRLSYCAEVNMIERVLVKYKVIRYIFLVGLFLPMTLFNRFERKNYLEELFRNNPKYDEWRYKVGRYLTFSVMAVFLFTTYGVLLFTAESNQRMNSTLQSNRQVQFGPLNAYLRLVSGLLCAIGDRLIGSITVDDKLRGSEHVCPVCSMR